MTSVMAQLLQRAYSDRLGPRISKTGSIEERRRYWALRARLYCRSTELITIALARAKIEALLGYWELAVELALFDVLGFRVLGIECLGLNADAELVAEIKTHAASIAQRTRPAAGNRRG